MCKVAVRAQIALVFLILSHGTLILPAFASAELQQQRQDYLDATRALKKGDLDTFHALYTRLDDYILQGYLQYEFLKERISSTPIGAIREFLDENKHAPISAQLRNIWLEYLATAGDEETFLKEHRKLYKSGALGSGYGCSLGYVISQCWSPTSTSFATL